MIERVWYTVQQVGLRFYRLAPVSGVEILFTTRRVEDKSVDHNLHLQGQLNWTGLRQYLVTMNQTHSDRVLRVNHPGEVEADGCFTTEENLALSVRVADCVPLFFWGGDGMIGVVHAGWRGTLSKIALRFTEKVERELGIPPNRLFYSLGPSIGNCCYRVGEEILEDFRTSWSNADRFFKHSSKGLYLDIRAANRYLVSSVGAREGASLDMCTSCEAKRFYSHRREPSSGRNWGVIIRKRD